MVHLGCRRKPVSTCTGSEWSGYLVLHRCGGYARCTTCCVAFSAGEPEQMTQTEYNKLDLQDLLGEVRLACQIQVDQDMRPLMTIRSSSLSDLGSEPKEDITPALQWMTPHLSK